MLQLRRRRRHWEALRKFLIVDKNHGTAIAEYICQRRSLLADADGHRNSPQSEHCEQDGRKCDAVAEQEGHAFTTFHAQLCKGRRPPIDDRIEASVTEAIFLANDGFRAGTGRHGSSKKRMHALWPNRKTAHDTVTVMPLLPYRGHGAKPPRRRLGRFYRAIHQTNLL